MWVFQDMIAVARVASISKPGKGNEEISQAKNCHPTLGGIFISVTIFQVNKILTV